MLVDLTADELMAVHRGLGRLLDRQAENLKTCEALQFSRENLDYLAERRADYDRTVALRVKIRNAMNVALSATETADAG